MDFMSFVVNNLGHTAPLIMAAVLGIAIIAERARALFVIYPMKNAEAFFEKVRELVLAGNNSSALALCDAEKDKPVARLVKAALLRAHQPEEVIENGLELAMNDLTHSIQRRTNFLATIANVATLLGLFGTILGLIHSFEAVGHADAQQKSALLAAGISTSMNATMFGLGIAIPCMIAFSLLVNRANQLNGELENTTIRILDILKQRYYGMPAGVENGAGEKSDDAPVSNGKGHGEKVTPIRRAA